MLCGFMSSGNIGFARPFQTQNEHLSGQKHFCCCCRPSCTYHPVSNLFSMFYPSARHTTVRFTGFLYTRCKSIYFPFAYAYIIKPKNLFEQIAQNHYRESFTNDCFCTTSNNVSQKSLQMSRYMIDTVTLGHELKFCKCITFKVDLSCSAAASTNDSWSPTISGDSTCQAHIAQLCTCKRGHTAL